jgi:hypothetical protein
MRFALLTLLAICVAGRTAQSQAPATPTPALLQVGTDTLYQYLVRGSDTVFTGTVVDALERVDIAGRAVLRRVYAGDSQLTGPSRDTLIDDAATLRPWRTVSYSTRGIEQVEYGEDRAVGWLRQPTGDSVRIDAALPAPVFSASSFDLVLRASALAEGWSATVPAFVPSSRVVVPMTARVDRTERIDGAECWRVAAEFMGRPVTFWVDRETRKLCRQDMTVQVGVSLLLTRRGPASMRRARSGL